MATIQVRNDGVLVTHDDGRQELYADYAIRNIVFDVSESSLAKIRQGFKECDISHSSVKARVANSVKLLDSKSPGWWYKVQPSTGARDIGRYFLKALYRDVLDGYRILGITKSSDYAFDGTPVVELDAEWKAVIKSRLPSAFT